MKFDFIPKLPKDIRVNYPPGSKTRIRLVHGRNEIDDAMFFSFSKTHAYRDLLSSKMIRLEAHGSVSSQVNNVRVPQAESAKRADVNKSKVSVKSDNSNKEQTSNQS